jgi:two-component system chemotaxis sensor kinase CheA
MDHDLIGTFLEESRELVAEAEQVILHFEHADSAASGDKINALFRHLHTIKGGAGLFRLNRITELTHAMESIVSKVRENEMGLNENLISVLLLGIDKLKFLMDDPSNEAISIEEDLINLRSHLQSCEDQKSGMEDDLQKEPDGQDDFEQQMAFGFVDFNALPDEPEVISEDQQQAEMQQRQPAVKEKTPEPPSDGGHDSGPRKPNSDQSVRIPLGLLDKMMNLASELVLIRNRNAQAVLRRDFEQIELINHHLNVITSDIQATVMQTRLRPIDTVFRRFSRIVRDISLSLGKEIEFTTHGGEVELDKNFVEVLVDPLTHLIRNSIDHGIEEPSVRQKVGKSSVGNISLSASHQAGQVYIELEDDGKGINPDVIREVALRKGVASRDSVEKMSDSDAINLIFEPGFSTAEKITDISGRGVGMDVVKTNLKNLGGAVELSSKVGEGTKVIIKLPLTLAIMPALIVDVAQSRFAIPQSSIDQVVWLYGNEIGAKIKHIDNQDVYRWQDRLLPIVDLAKILNIKRESSLPEKYLEDELPVTPQAAAENWYSLLNSLFLVILKLGKDRFGVLVDRVIDTEEIVVKALHDHLIQCEVFTGTTVLGDGSIAMILDTLKLAAIGEVNFTKNEAAIDRNSMSFEERQKVLLFDIGTRERFAVPLYLIRRIEKALVANIQKVGDREYYEHGGTLIPLVRVERALGMLEANYQQDHVFLIIPKGQKCVGIVAATIQDTTEVVGAPDLNTLFDKGVIGTRMIGGHLTMFIDIHEMIEMTDPAWLKQATTFSEPTKKLLVVDDSAFFRTMIKNYLKNHGAEVVTAEDGRAALHILGKETFDGIISDIEMPNLDGWGLIKAIRQMPSDTKNIPVVAISLAQEKSLNERAKDAGFNKFCAKNDELGMFQVIKATFGLTSFEEGNLKWKSA